MIRTLFIYLSLILLSASCVDITDDLTIHADGTGTFKYVVNLSQSKVKVNSYLALDSLDGKKVPSIDEIKETINEYALKLEQKEGISNVKVETDFKNFILRFQCDFTSVANLQKAIKEIAQERDKNKEFKEINTVWVSFDGDKLIRSVPTLTTQTTSKLKKEDSEELKKGKYVSVTRFDQTIDRCENTSAIVNPSKTACMIKTNPYALIQNTKLLENTIYLNNEKKN
jgi:hypothetical protein